MITWICYLYLQVRASKDNGSELPPDANVGHTTMWKSTLFSDCEVSLNDHPIEVGMHMYHYRAYISMLPKYGSDAKKEQLEAYGFVPDIADRFEHDCKSANSNDGLVTRRKHIVKNKIYKLCGPVFADLFHQPCYLLPRVDVLVKFVRQRPEFALIKFDNALNVKITLIDAVLYVRNVTCFPSILATHEKGLQSQNVLYPIQKNELTSFIITRGMLAESKDNPFQSKIPKLLIIGLVSNSAFSGRYDKNPFLFKNYSLNYVSLTLDGDNILHCPFTPDFETDNIAREYLALYQALGYFNRDKGNGLDLHAYGGGNMLFAFNLAPNQALSREAQPRKEGLLRLELKFGIAFPKTINVILYGIFDEQVEITQLRDVLCRDLFV